MIHHVFDADMLASSIFLNKIISPVLSLTSIVMVSPSYEKISGVLNHERREASQRIISGLLCQM
jgi:hypothetical protein